jgi:hypothetical protein
MRMLGGDIIRCIASLGEAIGWRVGGGHVEAMPPTRVALIGDGDLHMKIRGDVDCLVGCGDEVPSGC